MQPAAALTESEAASSQQEAGGISDEAVHRRLEGLVMRLCTVSPKGRSAGLLGNKYQLIVQPSPAARRDSDPAGQHWSQHGRLLSPVGGVPVTSVFY